MKQEKEEKEIDPTDQKYVDKKENQLDELSSIANDEAHDENNERSIKEFETQFRRFLIDQMLGEVDKHTIIDPMFPGSIP